MKTKHRRHQQRQRHSKLIQTDEGVDQGVRGEALQLALDSRDAVDRPAERYVEALLEEEAASQEVKEAEAACVKQEVEEAEAACV